MSRYTTLPTTILENTNQKFVPGYKTIKYPTIPLRDDDVWVITTEGDRLDILSNQFYGRDDLWWIISISNPDKVTFGSIFIEPGKEMRIPVDFESILFTFNKLNK